MKLLIKLTVLFVLLGLFSAGTTWANEALAKETKRIQGKQPVKNTRFMPPPGPYRVLPRRGQNARSLMPMTPIQNARPGFGQRPMIASPGMPSPRAQAAVPPVGYGPPPWGQGAAKPEAENSTAGARANASNNTNTNASTNTAQEIPRPTMQQRPQRFQRPPPMSGPPSYYGGYGYGRPPPTNWRPPAPAYRGPPQAAQNWTPQNRAGQNRPNPNWRPPVYQRPPPNYARPQGVPPWVQQHRYQY